MVWKWPACVAALAITSGCGRLNFASHERGDGGSDAMLRDARGDGRPCAAGHDEDGDGVDDGCDVCPNVADPDQRDRDGDGVGDACDPFPDVPGDRLVTFDPFTSIRPEWKLEQAQLVGDALALDGVSQEASLARLEAPHHATYEVGGRILTTSGDVQLALARIKTANDPWHYCELIDVSTPGSVLSLTYTSDGSSYTHAIDAPGPVLAPGPIVLRYTDAFPVGICHTTWPTTPSDLSAQVPGPDQTTQVDIFLKGATMNLDYFVEYESP